MSENQPKDDKSERKKRKKEKREQEKREQEQREQDKKGQIKNEEQPTPSSASASPKKKKSRRVYYSAISASEDEDAKYFDVKSSTEAFRDSISRTDNEVDRSVPQTTITFTNAASETLPSIAEDVNELDAQPETSKAIQAKKKQGKEAEPAMTMEKEAEKAEEKTQKKQEENKIERKVDNAGNERAKSKRDSKEKASEKAHLPKVTPVVPVTESSELNTTGSKAAETNRPKTELEKFAELSDYDNDDSDSYEMYIEKMKGKRKKMSKSIDKGNHQPAEPWGHGERTYLAHGGAFVYMVIPPDGGYGWLVLLVSFLCQVIVDGIVFSLGIVLPFIAEDMGSSPSSASLVASTQIGPITSAFINKYGFRPVALLGATMAICTILISTLSPNLATLIIFYSIFGGMSLSMIWSSSQLIVGYYFERWRPIASGISCSGAGAGVLIFSYMNSQLAPEVGWRNTSRIHALFLVFVVLIVLFYIEVAPTRIGRMLEHNMPDTETDSDETGIHSFFYSRITLHDPTAVNRHSRSLQGNLFVQYEPISREPSRLNKCFQNCCPPFRRFMEQRIRAAEQDPDAKRVVIRQDPLDRQDIYYTGPTDYEEFQHTNLADILNDEENDMQIEVLPAANQKSIHYNLANRQGSLSRHSIRSQDARSIKGSNAFLDFISPAHWVHPKVKRAFNTLFDLRLLAIMEFQVLLASAFFFPMGFNIPFVYSKVRAEMDPSYTDLISPVIGLSNFFFRIASGVVAFKFRRHTTAICGYGIVFGGVITLLSSVYGNDVVWFQFMFAVCFAIAPAFYSTLRAIIYVQVLGLDKLTNAFGLTAMAMGAGVFIGTFTGGLLIEMTGNYVATFAFSGSCMILAGSLKLLLPTLIIWKTNRRTRKRTHFKNAGRK